MRPLAPRLTAVILALLCAALPGAVTATDPTEPPEAPAPPDGAVTPTIHAEMLAANADLELDLAPGEAPSPLPGGDAGRGGLSTLAEPGGSLTTTTSGMRREVLGYLPYWALSGPYLGTLRYDRLTTIAYFSVPAQADGTLLTTGPSSQGWQGWTSSAMSGVITRAHQSGVRVVLTVTMMAWDFDYSAMSAVLNDPAVRARLADNIATAVRSRNADGVNLDFEPMPNSLQDQYTTFVHELKARLAATGTGSYLTVATTGGAASWDEGYDLAGIVAPGGADALMVMAYDFNWAGSARAGGVAPIDSPYILDVRDAMRDHLRRVPAAKIIWGVPYYGRAWTTTSDAQNSPTCRSTGSCRHATWAPRYIDALDAVAERGRRWDSTGQVPWYTYRSDTYQAQVQGYYDDAESLDAKYQLVNANDLAGIGIWHLTMDGSRTELWGAIARRFAELPFADLGSSPFVEEIVWLSNENITNGCAPERFCPTDAVRREQMASFLARALNLPPASRDHFADDAGNLHEADINRVAEAGITLGCGAAAFCPATPVTRDQMASFLARALGLPEAANDHFTDDAGNLHEADINRIAEAGITLGCGSGRYCPATIVSREQMAAFLFRARFD